MKTIVIWILISFQHPGLADPTLRFPTQSDCLQYRQNIAQVRNASLRLSHMPVPNVDTSRCVKTNIVEASHVSP